MTYLCQIRHGKMHNGEIILARLESGETEF